MFGINLQRLYMWPLSFAIGSFLYLKFYRYCKKMAALQGRPFKDCLDNTIDLYWSNNKHQMEALKLGYDIVIFSICMSFFITTIFIR